MVEKPVRGRVFALGALARIADADGQPADSQLDCLFAERLRRLVRLRSPSPSIAGGDGGGIHEIQALSGSRHGWPRFVHDPRQQLNRIARAERKSLVHVGIRRTAGETLGFHRSDNGKCRDCDKKGWTPHVLG